MNRMLAVFMHEERKQDGTRYPGKTLFELITSLQKVFELEGKVVHLLKDEHFKSVKLALDMEMQISAKGGLGMRERSADFISI